VDPIKANYAAISPRIFEYAAAKCLLALTPGKYSGILVPGVHYFELQSDLSNFKDLLLLMNNDYERNRMIDKSYQDLISSRLYGYENMVAQVDFWVEQFLGDLGEKEIPTAELLRPEDRITPSKQNDIISLLRLVGKSAVSFARSVKRKIYEWAISRRGLTRFILRIIFRSLRLFWESKFFRYFRILSSVNFQLTSEFKKTFIVTKSIFTSARLISELEFIKVEAQNLALQNCILSITQTNSGIWISWPESLREDSFLKEHPRLDGLHFRESEGVWFTRSDFSEIHKPISLSSLSKYYAKDKQKTIKLIKIFCD